MNRKGQTLVIFIVILPLIILGFSFLVDTGLMYIGKTKLISTCKTLISDYYDKEFTNEDIKEYLDNNHILYDDYEINRKDNNLVIKVDGKIKSIFGKLIGKEEYPIKVQLTGTKEDTKLKFEYE